MRVPIGGAAANKSVLFGAQNERILLFYFRSRTRAIKIEKIKNIKKAVSRRRDTRTYRFSRVSVVQ